MDEHGCSHEMGRYGEMCRAYVIAKFRPELHRREAVGVGADASDARAFIRVRALGWRQLGRHPIVSAFEGVGDDGVNGQEA